MPDLESPSAGLEPIERGISLLRTRVAGGLLALLGGAVLLLVLACANIAGLLLALAAARLWRNDPSQPLSG